MRLETTVAMLSTIGIPSRCRAARKRHDAVAWRCAMRSKRIAIVAGGIVVLLVVAAVAAVALIDVNRYRGQVASQLANSLNREITLGRLSLSLLPLGLRVQNVVIGEARAFQTGRPFARVRELLRQPEPDAAAAWQLRAARRGTSAAGDRARAWRVRPVEFRDARQ